MNSHPTYSNRPGVRRHRQSRVKGLLRVLDRALVEAMQTIRRFGSLLADSLSPMPEPKLVPVRVTASRGMRRGDDAAIRNRDGAWLY